MLIRVCLGAALLYAGASGVPDESSEPILVAQKAASAAGGMFLLAGLWTPAIGVLIAFNEIAIALSSSLARVEDLWSHVFLAVLAAGIAMLGPGAWSIDARLFGRKRFDIDRTAGRKRSL